MFRSEWHNSIHLIIFHLYEIRCQFHQHFMRKFFVQMLFQQLFYRYMYVEKAAKTMFVRKICAQNVDEIDTRGQFHQQFTCSFLRELGSISSMFYEQLLGPQILKVQKIQSSHQSFLHFWDLLAWKLLVEPWWNGLQIPKWKKYIQVVSLFFAFGICVRKN